MEICDESQRQLQPEAVIQSPYQVKYLCPVVIDVCWQSYFVVVTVRIGRLTFWPRNYFFKI